MLTTKCPGETYIFQSILYTYAFNQCRTFVVHIVEEIAAYTEPLKKAPVVKVLFKFDLHSIEIFIENYDLQKLQMTGTKC